MADSRLRGRQQAPRSAMEPVVQAIERQMSTSTLIAGQTEATFCHGDVIFGQRARPLNTHRIDGIHRQHSSLPFSPVQVMTLLK
jgi:hypothetical protein